MPAILQIEDLSKYIGELVLFENVRIQLNEGEKAALVGINGAGKSSLLNIIAQEDAPDRGVVHIASGKKIGYLLQDPVLDEEKTVMETLFRSENENVQFIRAYEEAIISGNMKEIGKQVSRMDNLKLWDFENKIKQILTQLHITDYHQKTGELSGGQKKRIALANTLLNEPDLLILDEPTNHLDLGVIEWLESYLQRSSVSLLMVTHDRFFLDRICNIIYEIDRKSIYRYQGNYSRFVELRQKRIEQEETEVEKAQNLLRKEEEWMRRMPQARGTKAKYRIDNYYRLKEKSEQGRSEKSMNIAVSESRLGSKILVAKNLFFKWDDTWYLNDFSYTFSRFEKIGIIGNNGSGKSTFLEIMTGNLKPESGILETGETIKFGYYRQAGIEFDENMKVLDAVTRIAETITMSNGSMITASQFLNYFLFPYPRQHDYIYKLSGGEKRRLYLCTVLMQNPNFLILDEPTNDLDISSLQVLEEYLSAFNGCVMVVSHDRYFMDSVVDHLFVFRGSGEIKDYPGNYSAYFEWKNEQVKSDNQKIPAKEKKEKAVVPKKSTKLSYYEKRELEQLETEINKFEKEKSTIENELNSGTLGTEELMQKSKRLGEILSIIDAKSDRWLELSERAGH